MPVMKTGQETFSLYSGRLQAQVNVTVDHDRDLKLTDFGTQTLRDRYLMPGETPQALFARVAAYYSDDEAHAQRLYNYISNLWFMPATPVLSNGGTSRGYPISCFLNSVGDSLQSIVGTWEENSWLAARGGGIGTYWGDVRGIGEKVGVVGKSSGIIPFIHVMDSMTLAISQGSLRRGSAAVYLSVSHPEIEEFVELRRPTGDGNRRSLNVHNGVCLTDEFMRAVEKGEPFALRSPVDNAVVKLVDARALWQRILTARVELGEPYMLFIDTVNRMIPEHQKFLGLTVKQSNLCSEITLPTGKDHLGNDRTAVCCLSSLNVEYFEEWSGDRNIVEDALRFLDNVLDDFLRKTEGVHGFERARYSAMRERSVGLGVMGLHSYFQRHNVPFAGVMAKVHNKRVFAHIRNDADKANAKLGRERGSNPDAAEAGFIERRFSNMMAIAPTASISIICGGTSPGIEPNVANVFLQKTLSGSFKVRNPYLLKLLAEHGQDTPEVWTSIITNEGSVQHLEFLDEHEKEVFKTAVEIDQAWVIDLAADRAPLIDQAQSVNLFLRSNVSKKELNALHFSAWKKGLKSLYYLRSLSIQRAEVVSHTAGSMPTEEGRPDVLREEPTNFEADECLACQ